MGNYDVIAGGRPRVFQLVPCVRASDVINQLGCSRSFAYFHLKRCAQQHLGRGQGVRGMLRVPVHAWESYWKEVLACGTTHGSTSGAGSGGDGSTASTATASTSARGAATRMPRAS